jgi:hypothetical protein
MRTFQLRRADATAHYQPGRTCTHNWRARIERGADEAQHCPDTRCRIVIAPPRRHRARECSSVLPLPAPTEQTQCAGAPYRRVAI